MIKVQIHASIDNNILLFEEQQLYSFSNNISSPTLLLKSEVLLFNHQVSGNGFSYCWKCKCSQRVDDIKGFIILCYDPERENIFTNFKNITAPMIMIQFQSLIPGRAREKHRTMLKFTTSILPHLPSILSLLMS